MVWLNETCMTGRLSGGMDTDPDVVATAMTVDTLYVKAEGWSHIELLVSDIVSLTMISFNSDFQDPADGVQLAGDLPEQI